MRLHKIRRRHLLMGAGGFTLALPWLPSLSRAGQGGAPPPRFIAVATGHGGAWTENAFPDASTLTESHEAFPGHTIARGDLVASPQGGDAVLSPMLRAPQSELSDAVIAKLNVFAGLDIMYYLDHHAGAYLGNFDARSRFFEGVDPGELIPTVDQVLGWSPKFYPNLDGILVRSLHLNRSFSWGFENPSAQTGEIVEVPASPSSQAAFDQIFVPDDDPEALALRARREFVVDRVHEHYASLRDGVHGDAARISKQDRARIELHLERLSALEHRLTTHVSCGEIEPPSPNIDGGHEGVDRSSDDVAAAIEAHSVFNDVIVAAMACGTSRIATVMVRHTFSSAFNDYQNWHNEVEHLAQTDNTAQTRMYEAQGRVFRHAFLDLVNKLDVDEGGGRTMLDNSLVVMVPQFGARTHASDSIPIVTAGSAGGALATGNYIDYRNHAAENMGTSNYRRPGIAYNQFLGTALQAMGLAPSDYERDGIPGYGVPTVGNPQTYPGHILSAAGETLPYLAR